MKKKLEEDLEIKLNLIIGTMKTKLIQKLKICLVQFKIRKSN